MTPNPFGGTLEAFPIDPFVQAFEDLGMGCFQTECEFQSGVGAEFALEGENALFPDEFRVAFDHEAFVGACLSG